MSVARPAAGPVGPDGRRAGARSASSWRSRPAPSSSSPTPAIADSAATHRLSAPRSSPSIRRHHRSRCRSSVATAFVLLRVDPGRRGRGHGLPERAVPALRRRRQRCTRTRRSPATYINGSRYGGGTIPDGASRRRRAGLGRGRRPPGSGEYAWHDHRAHLMDAGRRRSARERGDQVFDRCAADRRRRSRRWTSGS